MVLSWVSSAGGSPAMVMTELRGWHVAEGPDEEVARLLTQAAAGGGDLNRAWVELWEKLLHCSEYVAVGYAVIPRLAELAVRFGPAVDSGPLQLAAAIMGTDGDDDVEGDAAKARRESAAALRDLEGQALRSLQLPQLRDDGAGFLRLLQAVLAFRGVPVWSNQLAHLVEGEEELELDCPWCGEYHLAGLSPSEGFTLRGHVDGEEVVRAIEPAGPASLDDVGEWLHRTATQHTQPAVAVQVVHLFGRSRCIACDEGFRVSDGVLSLRGQFAPRRRGPGVI